MTRQRLPSTQDQLKALKKKGVNVGRAKTKWSVYRLYNFYVTQHHSVSAPRYQAYATGKRLEERIERSAHPERMMLRTGTGKKISARSLIRQRDKASQKEFERSLPPNVTFQYARRYRTIDKVRDHAVFIIQPPIEANVMTLDQAHRRAEQVITQLLDVIHLAQRLRGRFYKDYVVGGKIIAEGRGFDVSEDMPKNPPIVVSMPWTGLLREDYMFHRMFMDQGFEDVFKTLHQYSEKATVIVYRVELKFSTNRRPSNTDRLRSE